MFLKPKTSMDKREKVSAIIILSISIVIGQEPMEESYHAKWTEETKIWECDPTTLRDCQH